jgi:predicted lipopolysaccharide heptosyltransferase III
MYKIINKKKRFLVSTADLICRSVFFWKKQSPVELISPHQIKKILIIRLAYLGDVVMTLPILQPLSKHFTEAKIFFLTSSSAAELLQGNPYLDKIISYDAFWFYQKRIMPAIKEYYQVVKKIRKEDFDLVIDFRGDIRNILLIAYLSQAPYRISYEIGGGGNFLTSVVPFLEIKHKVEYHLDTLRFLGINTQEWDWNIYLDPTEIEEMEIALKPGNLIIGIHPGARKPLKCWESEKFALLADRIIEEYSAKVVFFGAPHERNLIESIKNRMKRPALNIAGKTTLRQLAAAIRCCHLFIGNDSGPIHIAAAMQVPTVAIFGPSKSNETRPYGNIHRVVEIRDMPCRNTCDEDQCHFEHPRECIRLISPQAVFQAVEQQLAYPITRINTQKRN